MNVDNARDCGTFHWSDGSTPGAAAVVRSPVFDCSDPPGAGPYGAGATLPTQQVRGPGVDVFIIVPTASAGAIVTLVGNGAITLWTASVAAGGTFNMCTLLAAALGAAAPSTYNSPARTWQVSFANGATPQAGAISFLVRAGGWV